jgi:glycolate oxidase FAD binding subunit
MSVSLRSALEDLVSSDALLAEGESNRWSPGESAPLAVVAPSTEVEMGTVLARASQEGWRVLPAGQGTWLRGGGRTEADLVVSTRRMSGIEEYEPADLTFTAGAGITLSALGEATASNGQWLPIDPPGGLRGSLGAAVSLGVGGPLRQLYGPPRDHILGLSMVSGDGRILRWGGRVVKNVAGFDLTRMSIGSWGTLGVVTSVSARLFPIPEAELALILRGPRAESLLPAAVLMARSPLPLASIELLDPLADPGAGVGSGAGLVLRLLGSRAQVAEMESRIRSDLSGEGAGWERAEGDESKTLHERLCQWERGAELVLRLALLPSHLETLYGEMAELRDAVGKALPEGAGEVRTSAHVGAGILRVAVSGPLPQGPGLGIWASVLGGLRIRLEDRGGSLTLSRAPGPLLDEVGAWGSVGDEATLLKGIKKQFDPQGILAPGRFVV